MLLHFKLYFYYNTEDIKKLQPRQNIRRIESNKLTHFICLISVQGTNVLNCLNTRFHKCKYLQTTSSGDKTLIYYADKQKQVDRQTDRRAGGCPSHTGDCLATPMLTFHWTGVHFHVLTLEETISKLPRNDWHLTKWLGPNTRPNSRWTGCLNGIENREKRF